MDRCPVCNSKLYASFAETISYEVLDLDEDEYVDVDYRNGEPYHSEFIDIHCSGCDRTWHRIEQLLELEEENKHPNEDTWTT